MEQFISSVALTWFAFCMNEHGILSYKKYTSITIVDFVIANTFHSARDRRAFVSCCHVIRISVKLKKSFKVKQMPTEPCRSERVQLLIPTLSAVNHYRKKSPNFWNMSASMAEKKKSIPLSFFFRLIPSLSRDSGMWLALCLDMVLIHK